MRSAFVLLSVVAAALGQALTVNTPTGAINCLNQAISWVGGTGPYTIQIQPGGDPTQAALETFTGLAASPYSWFVTEAANTQVFIRLRDNAGTTVESGTFTIRAGGTCPSGSASVSSPPVDSTSAAAPPAGSSSTPAAGGSASTPAPGGSSSGGSGSSSAATTRATTSTPNAAGLSAKVAGGVVAVVGGVAALLV